MHRLTCRAMASGLTAAKKKVTKILSQLSFNVLHRIESVWLVPILERHNASNKSGDSTIVLEVDGAAGGSMHGLEH